MKKLIYLCITIFLLSMVFNIDIKAEEFTFQKETTETSSQIVTGNEDNIKEGFVKENGKTRYYIEGEKHIGFLKLKGKKYYFNEKGNMILGNCKIGKYNYYFNENGVMQTGFVKFNKNRRKILKYYDKKGRLKTGTFIVSKIKYKARNNSGRIYYLNNIVRPICQKPQLPTGCEITSWTMMARHAGVKITKIEATKIMPRNNDPDKGFVGDPHYSYGGALVIYPNGLKKMTKKYLGNYKNLTGCKISKIKKFLLNKRLVMVWVGELDGFNSHTVLLTGYDNKYFYYNDPWTGSKRKINYGYFNDIWKLNSKRAMSY